MSLTRIFLIFTSISLLYLTACSGLTSSNKPVLRTWMLVPPQPAVIHDATESSRAIKVLIKVAPELDSDRILTLSDDAELNHISGARWSEHTPELFESLISRSLRDSGGFAVVTSQADCKLHVLVEEFFAYTGSEGVISQTRIKLSARIECESDLTKTVALQASTPVYVNQISTIVSAFQTGIDQIMFELLEELQKG